jgi:hypothetical protein
MLETTGAAGPSDRVEAIEARQGQTEKSLDILKETLASIQAALAALTIAGEKEDKAPAMDTTIAGAALLPTGTMKVNDSVTRDVSLNGEGSLVGPTGRNRVKHNLPVPVRDPKDPFMTLRR